MSKTMAISKQFILAGDATFTIEIPEAHRVNGKPHHTYRVQHVERSDRWPEAFFVKLLTGPDNENSYSYLGKLDKFTGQMATTGKSCLPADAFAVKLLNRVLARIWTEDHAAYEQHGFATHHEGKCCRCNRKLTTPESVSRGYGPECRKVMAVA